MNPKNAPLSSEEIARISDLIREKDTENLAVLLVQRLNRHWIKIDTLCQAINKYVEADHLDLAVRLWETTAKDYHPKPVLALVLIGGAVLWKLAVLAAVLGGVLYLARSCS